MVCEECGICLIHQGYRSFHDESFYHPLLTLINNNVRSGLVPLSPNLVEYFSQSVIKTEGVYCVESGLKRNERPCSRDLLIIINWVDLWALESFLSDESKHIPSVIETANRIKYAVRYCSTGMPWWQAWGMWSTNNASQKVIVGDTDLLISGFYDKTTIVLNDQKISIDPPQPPYCVDLNWSRGVSPFALQGVSYMSADSWCDNEMSY